MNIAIYLISLKNYFKFNYVFILAIAIILCVFLYCFLWWKQKVNGVAISKNKWISGFFLTLYAAFLLTLMVVGRERGQDYSMNLILFWSYKRCIQEYNQNLLLQIIFNVIVFIPWPILFAQVFPKMKKFLWSVGSAFLFSVFVEIMQLVFKLGMFEFDDMFHNTLGAVIGYAILTLARLLVNKYRLRKSN